MQPVIFLAFAFIAGLLLGKWHFDVTQLASKVKTIGMSKCYEVTTALVLATVQVICGAKCGACGLNIACATF